MAKVVRNAKAMDLNAIAKKTGRTLKDWTVDDEERLRKAMGRSVALQAQEDRDLTLAIGLLTQLLTQGSTDPKKIAEAKRYIEKNLEKDARAAIGRLLRNKKPLDRALRYHLAELFDGKALIPPSGKTRGGWRN
jgi:hypothetical protein